MRISAVNYDSSCALSACHLMFVDMGSCYLVQRHSSKICMNCALCDKSAKHGTDVEHIITCVLRYGAILKYLPGVYFADQNFKNLQTPRANWFWSLFC